MIRKAFTLIELLVVIAMIGILIELLLSAEYNEKDQKLTVTIDSEKWPVDKIQGTVFVNTTNPNEPVIRFPVLRRD